MNAAEIPGGLFLRVGASRETTAAKALRYVVRGRLTVTRVDGDLVEATCRGGRELYRLGHDPEGGWWCGCPARSRCCHLIALRACGGASR